MLTQAQANQKTSVEARTKTDLKNFVTDLKTELSQVFRDQDIEWVELTRKLTDWKHWAVQVKTRGAPFTYALEHSKYSRDAKKVSRSIREVDTEEIDNQFSIFLERLGKELDTEPISKIEKINSKDIRKHS